MSMPPPGYETPQASPPPPRPPAPQEAPPRHEDTKAHHGSRQADDNVQYEFMTVKALRGRESNAKSKWERQGWEFVSENRGTLRTELNFRRAKPKMIGDYLLSFVASFRRMQPTTRLVLFASCALILVAGSIGFAVGTLRGGDTADPSVAQSAASTTPPAEPTVTPITGGELLADDAEPSETSKPSERRAKARARARAKARARTRAKRRERAVARERQRNTAMLESGVTCSQLGETDILVTPGAEIDGDRDGVGCES
jgi:hypothetical protein